MTSPISQLRRSLPRARAAHRSLPSLLALCGLALMSAAGPDANAQEISTGASPEPESITRPALAGRVVRRFDFEERESNPLPVPQYWFRAQHDPVLRDRPGFPSWNTAELDYTAAATGIGSVRVPAKGGSGSLRLEPGVIPIFPGADYTINADVRTSDAPHARARITARYLDASGEPIAGSERSTEPIQTGGGWQAASLLMRGLKESAFLQVDLEMLQPREFERVLLPDFKVWSEDFDAQGWFDNVTVLQMPRIELATAQGSNVIDASDRPMLVAFTRDLTGQSLMARCVVRDLAGRVVDSTTRTIERGPGGLRWTPELPRLGWYHATLELFAAGEFVGGADIPIAWLDRVGPRGSDGSRFVMIFDRTDPGELARLPAYALAIGAGRVVVPGWTSDLTIANREAWFTQLSGVIDELIESRTEIAISLDRIPRELASQTGIDLRDPITLMSSHATDADPYLLRLLDRYGQSIPRWLLGSPSTGPVTSGEDLAARLERIDAAIGRFVPGPMIGVPWRAEIGLPPTLQAQPPDAMTVVVPASFARGGLAEWLRSFGDVVGEGALQSRDPLELTVLLGTSEIAGLSREAEANDLIQRGVEAWTMIDPLAERGVHLSIGMADPWYLGDVREAVFAPTPEAISLRSLASHLSDRRFVSRIPTPDGIHAYLFEPTPGAARERKGMMVVWADRSKAMLDLYLGPDAVRVSDPFGNATLLEPTGDSEVDAIRTHKLALTETPAFVEGVDADLVTMASSFRVDPPFLASINEMQERALVMHNPFAVPILVRYFLVEPGTTPDGQRDRAWSIVPRTGTLQIAPGTDGRIPITVIPSAMEEAGPKTFVLDAQVSADRSYGWMRLRSDVHLGLQNIRVDLVATPSPTAAGPHVVVDVHITNTGTQAATLEVVAVAPGLARQRSSISEMPPGTSAVRRFVFADAAASLRSERILVGVSDTATGGRLNSGVTLSQD